jgi:hypothetical protein
MDFRKTFLLPSGTKVKLTRLTRHSACSRFSLNNRVITWRYQVDRIFVPPLERLHFGAALDPAFSLMGRSLTPDEADVAWRSPGPRGRCPSAAAHGPRMAAHRAVSRNIAEQRHAEGLRRN